MHYRYPGYPDVQLVDFSRAGPSAEMRPEEDMRSIVRVIEEVFINWSDAARLLTSVVDYSDDLTMLLL